VDNAALWGLPAAKLTALGDGVMKFAAILGKCQGETRTSADVQDKNDQREALERALRAFVNAHIRVNEAVTNADRVRLGFTVPRAGHPIPETTGAPELEVDISTFLVIVLRYRARGGLRWGKPPHVHGIVVRHEMRGDNPGNFEELRHTVFDTGGTLRISFNQADAGKRVVFVGRWVMGKVDGVRGLGPWGTPIVVHVPG
jgi:hypothetical protein